MLLVIFINALIREPILLITFVFFNKILEVHISDFKIAPDQVCIVLRHTDFLVSPPKSARVLLKNIRQASQDTTRVIKSFGIDHNEQISACLLITVAPFKI
jgi:hypothetical protein